LAIPGALLATLSMAFGLVIERWLFFAEAEHVSMLYYGADSA
jgi:sulfite dehydrogenase (quinone) subunit SoeC